MEFLPLFRQDMLDRGWEQCDFVYVIGYYEEKPVFVSVPAASLDEFMAIDSTDIAEIKRDHLKMYVESRTSKSNRQYFVAWIDD